MCNGAMSLLLISESDKGEMSCVFLAPPRGEEDCKNATLGKKSTTLHAKFVFGNKQRKKDFYVFILRFHD